MAQQATAQCTTSPVRSKSSTAVHSKQTQTSINIDSNPSDVEFPFPKANQSPQNEQQDELPATTSGALEEAKPLATRPGGIKRAATAQRPLARTQTSFAPLKRANTMVPPNIFDPSLWDSDSDSDSSSAGNGNHGATTADGTPKANGIRTRSEPNDHDHYRRFAVGNADYQTSGKVSKRDGRLKINMKERHKKGYLAKTLEATLRHRLEGQGLGESQDVRPVRPELQHAGTMSTLNSVASLTPYVPESIPRLNIVIMVIGSRGDIQPFLRLGKVLKEKHGHRVRIATHPAFREFVEQDTDLEFFSVGGDPAELMAFMVKNPGLIPKAKTIRDGEIAKRREAMYEMFQGFWRACINTTDDERDIANLKMMGGKDPFVADAIIANPPSFAHVHCAERLGIPLHLMFTFPTTPTQQFPHPLANIKQSNVDRNYTNFMSYPLVDMMTWQGLGDLVNRFRVKSLGLEPISTLWAPGQIFRMRVPHAYMISPALLSKPEDWGPEIDVTGFVFLDLASSFKPPKDLEDFLSKGDPPVYIGFGSIVVDDPERFTSLIFESVKTAGVRALVSQGWGGLGGDADVPDNVFILGNTPHDWLFPRVSAVVHHGGAGTTAIGLKCGKPTMVVPFFGDQAFWGSLIYKAGAGAEPMPYKHLTAEVLATSIQQLLTPDCQTAAKKLADQIAEEGDGAANAVDSFHRALPLRGNHSMRCSILDDRVAVWWLKGTHVRLSALAAEILVQSKRIGWKDLHLVRHYDWNDFEGPGEPITGAGGALVRTAAEVAKGVGGTPARWKSTIRNRHEQGTTTPRTLTEGGEPDRENTSEKNERSSQAQEKKGATNFPVSMTSPGAGEALLAKKLQPQSENLVSPTQHTEIVPPNTSVLAGAEGFGRTHLASDLAAGTGKGAAQTARALARAPVDMSLALAQGFHNAPRLWGDETVRTPRRVIGIRSGLRAARDEFAFGIYDGATGLIQHPYHGAKTGGALGFARGISKGIGGAVIKGIAAFAGIPAYTFKGIQKEISNRQQSIRFVRRAHLIQGQQELTAMSKEDLRAVMEKVADGWRVIVTTVQQKQQLEKEGLAGRLFVRGRKKKWKKNGVFESVEQMEQALYADREGRDFHRAFRDHRRELKKADQFQTPRKSAGERLKVKSSTTSPTKSQVPRSSLERILRGPKKSSESKHGSKTPVDGAEDAVAEPSNISTTDFQPVSSPSKLDVPHTEHTDTDAPIHTHEKRSVQRVQP